MQSTNYIPANRPETLPVHHSVQKNDEKQPESPKTSFAQMGRNNQNLQQRENAAPVTTSSSSAALKSAISRPGSSQGSKEKKTTFSMLPNFTTWEQSAQKSEDDSQENGTEQQSDEMLASEMFEIKMKLEEKRKQIRSKKQTMEMQWNKQRQKVGKQVFMQVLAKGTFNNCVLD